MSSPLRFILPKELNFSVTHNVPHDAQYNIPFAQHVLVQWQYGYFFEQRVIHQHFGFSLLSFQVEKRLMFTIEAQENFSAMQYTLDGECFAYLAGYGLLPLIADTITPVYIPIGTHYVWFEAGHYSFLYIVLTKDHLRDLVQDHIDLSILMEKLSSLSKTGAVIERLPIDKPTRQILRDIEASENSGTKLNFEIQQRIIDVLLAYTNLRQKSAMEQDSTKDQWANRIRWYILDHIDDVHLTRMENLEKVFYANERTLERAFSTFFNKPLRQYIKEIRFQRAFYLLQLEFMTVDKVAEQQGFEEAINFVVAFKRYFGFHPKEAKSNY